jgi:hypothetical protein
LERTRDALRCVGGGHLLCLITKKPIFSPLFFFWFFLLPLCVCLSYRLVFSYFTRFFSVRWGLYGGKFSQRHKEWTTTTQYSAMIGNQDTGDDVSVKYGLFTTSHIINRKKKWRDTIVQDKWGFSWHAQYQPRYLVVFRNLTSFIMPRTYYKTTYTTWMVNGGWWIVITSVILQIFL